MPIEPTDLSLYHDQALISLVYDDGQQSNFDYALPLHLEFNLPAGFAIIAQRSQEPRYWKRYMHPWQVTEASRQGVEIYSHSYSHPRLTDLNDAALDLELRKSQEILDGLVTDTQPKKVLSLAIPFSASNDRVIAAAKKYYSAIRIRGDKTTPIRTGTGNDPVVNAYGLARETTFEDVRQLVDRAVSEKSWLTLTLHGVARGNGQPERFNDIDAPLLRKVLTYIKLVGADEIMPINLSDIHAIRARPENNSL